MAITSFPQWCSAMDRNYTRSAGLLVPFGRIVRMSEVVVRTGDGNAYLPQFSTNRSMSASLL